MTATAAAGAPTTVRFGRWLAAIVAVGVVVRVVYVLVVVRHTPLGADAIWYGLQGAFIRDGRGYIDPATFFDGRSVPTATFPPLYPSFLAVVSWFESSATTTLRLAGCAPAGATMVLTALLARRVLRDDRVALVAAAIVAVSPLVVATDTSLMSETLSVPLSLLALLLVHRLTDRRRPVDLALLGLVVGVGMLARNDVILLAVVAMLLVLGTARIGWRSVLVSTLAVLLIAGLVVSPWVLRNVRALDVATLSTTSFSSAVAGANCPATYYGDELGGWDFECISAEERTADNEVAYSDEILDRGISYALDHPGRVPVVLGARVLRVWGAWDPTVLAEREAVESRRYGWQLAGWAFGSATIVLALAGALALRGRRLALATLVAPLLAVTGTALLTLGHQRFRAPAEPALAILAAWAVVQLRNLRTDAPARAAGGPHPRAHVPWGADE